MQGILSVPIIVFGQKDGEYDLVYDIKKDGYKAAHVYENILHAYILWLINCMSICNLITELKFFVKCFVAEGNSGVHKFVVVSRS